MATKAKTKGPTAQRVAANVRALRKARNLDLAGLAGRMSDLGQPIGVTGISKLENGDRRVDVDDLVALAVALDVSPNRLLLPEVADDTPVDVTPEAAQSGVTLWRWATGHAPLPHDFWGRSDVDIDLDRLRRFELENRPHDPPDTWTLEQVEQHHVALSTVARAVRDAEHDGVPAQTINSYLSIVRSIGAGSVSATASMAGVGESPEPVEERKAET